MVTPGRYFWKLFIGNALLLVVVLVVSVWLIIGEFNIFYTAELGSHLESLAHTIKPVVGDRFDLKYMNELTTLAREIANQEKTSPEERHAVSITSQSGDNQESETQAPMQADISDFRLTLILPDGIVLADSAKDPQGMENHANRPEIIDAFKNGYGESVRHSSTVNLPLKYVAIRVGPEPYPHGVIRVSMPIKTIVARQQSAYRLFWRVLIVAVASAVMLVLGLAWIWSGRIRRITHAAKDLSRGDLSARVNCTGRDEVAVLARSLNQMRDHLAGQLLTIDRQRLLLESLLAQLHQGVIVVGEDGHIVMINNRARDMLKLIANESTLQEAVDGTPIRECIENESLLELLNSQETISEESTRTRMHGISELQLDVDSVTGAITLLVRASNVEIPAFGEGEYVSGEQLERTTGRMLVFTDITELTETIRMKTNFVTNASHQLRTPLSVIRASVETLLDMDFAQDTDAAVRFVDLVDRHSAKLEAMVADLLELSRVESASTRYERDTLNMLDVLRGIQTRWEEIVRGKGLDWVCEADKTITVTANQKLLQLVLDNLVDNAVKYTSEGSICLVCHQSGENVQIIVSDTGCGIAPEDHQRVFERFYQEDRAQNLAGDEARKRGTGLGLAIVKHSVAAMDGQIELDSIPNEGTRICLTLHP